MKHQLPDIGKIYLYVKDPFESGYQLLINGREKVVKASRKSIGIYWLFTNNWWCLWKFRRLESNKEKKMLVVFDYMIADMESDEKLSPIVTELSLWGIKINISLVFMS